MRVIHLAAGAAGMYCGSCMHDNRLVATLRAQGRDVLLVPLYTALRTDEPDVSESTLYYGGINVYLQQSSGLFRHTPWVVDRVFDSPAVLGLANRFAGRTSRGALGEMTLSVLRGEAGHQRKELAKLCAGLRNLKPDLIHLPNLMFVGVAAALKAALGVPVLCALAGEDIFLDALPEPARGEVFGLIRAQASDVDAFVAPTEYYARHATRHFDLPAERVHTIPMGIQTADFAERAAPPRTPFIIGYFARICPAKGLDALADAFIALRRAGRDCRLHAAGYLGPADRAYAEDIHARLRAAGLDAHASIAGELTRREKVEFLSRLHVLSVPTAYLESKGFYVLEALAAGVPVVQPDHGAFPELVQQTGGGVLFPAGDPAALAEALAGLMDDRPLRQQLATQGHHAVHAEFTAERMAQAAWALYEQIRAARQQR